MAKLSKEEIVESLKEMTMLEINELIKDIEATFGVSAAAPTAAAAAPVVAAAPTEVNVILVESGANKISVIKLFREATGLGLMEAKTAVEKGGATIKANAKMADAEKIKADFEAAGAKIKFE